MGRIMISTPHRHDAACGLSSDGYAARYASGSHKAFRSRTNAGGSFGVRMIEADQPAFDIEGAATSEAAFVHVRSGAPRVLLDVGDGLRDLGAVRDRIICYPPDTAQRTLVRDDHAVRIATLPTEKLAPLLARSRVPPSALEPFWGRAEREDRAVPIMERMWRLIQSSSPTDDLYLDGLTLQFLAVLSARAELSPVGASHADDDRVVRVIDYIHANMARSLTVAELAGVAGLSPSQFARVFKASTGTPVWSFVMASRVERAAAMVRGTREPLATIALACGFANQAHMTNLMRRKLGVTPKRLRQEG